MSRKAQGELSSPELTKDLIDAEKQFQKFDEKVKDLTLDRMNQAPLEETEKQTKLSEKEINNSSDIYLKPIKTISVKDKFNEKFRERWNFEKEYVRFVAENKELIGEKIELWTRPRGGIPAEFWNVPVNKPVWGPRYLAEQISKCRYHRLTMENKPISSDSVGTYMGNMVVENTIQRLDAFPVKEKASSFSSKF